MKAVELAINEKLQPVNIDDLHPFQGNLKDLSHERYEQLKHLIVKLKFSFVIHVWHSANDNQYYIIDGHQRLRTLQKMRDEGYEVPAIPCAVVEAINYKEAKEKVLAGTSQFGEMTDQGLYEFINEAGLDWRNVVADFRFPEIEPMRFVENYYGETSTGSASGGDSTPFQGPSIFSLDEIAQDAFNYFREKGFPYPCLELHEQKQELNKLLSLDLDSCVRSNCGYKIADSYNTHRFAASAISMSSPLDSFQDDKKLMKAIKWHLESGNIGTDFFGTLSIVNGTQACSNFRPAFAKYLYNTYCPEGGKVFDSSTGYGGRLVGFLASHCKEYIGTDPNVPTYQANVKMAEALGRHKRVKLFNSPIEDLDVTDFAGSCDFAFTSPPYFCKEIYSLDDTQSCHRYQTYEDWLSGFLWNMLEKQHSVLRQGGINIVNIEDVKVGGKEYALVKPTIEMAKEMGFEHIKTERFQLQARTSLVDGEKQIEDASEAVIILKRS